VKQLAAALLDGHADRREAAVARLRIIGARAIPELVTLVRSDAPADARAAALKALEGSQESRAADLALGALGDSDTNVAVAAIAVLRTWVTRETRPTVLDALTGVALDPARTDVVRLAALDALSELPRDLVQPVLLQASREALAAGAVEEPAGAREWLATHPDASLSELHALVTTIREHERREPAARVIQDWIVTRGAVHAALARRGSRVALYDLRESFDAAQSPLPLDFLTAVTAVGDTSCVEPLARAWAGSPREAWWRTRLSEAAADILRREKLTGRSAAVKRVRAKYPGFL
jgi:hypothetical protein